MLFSKRKFLSFAHLSLIIFFIIPAISLGFTTLGCLLLGLPLGNSKSVHMDRTALRGLRDCFLNDVYEHLRP